MTTFDAESAEKEALWAEIAFLQESLSDFAFRTEQVQWTSLSGSEGWDLAACKQIAEPLKELVQANPLLSRAVELRQGYVYGDGYNLRGSKAGLEAKMALPLNQKSFFSSQAEWSRMNARAYSGNYFFLKNNTGIIIQVPIEQIEKVVTGAEDPSTVMFVLRKWPGGDGKDKQAWYKTQWNTDKKTGALPPDQKGDVALDPKQTMFHFAFNAPEGSAIGVPDALAAMKWAEGYGEYLTNQAKLVRAYSRIAFKVQKNMPGGNRDAATSVANHQSTNTYGATALGDITAIPAMGSQVDFNNGRPLAGMVASAMSVGLDSLLSSAVGASRSVSDMLDTATMAITKTLQADEKFVIDTLVVALGAPKAHIDFPSLDQDPMYRRIQALAQLTAQGALHREEFREIALDLMDISDPLEGLPGPDGFNHYNNQGSDPTPRQGNSGAVGGFGSDDNEARDGGEYDS